MPILEKKKILDISELSFQLKIRKSELNSNHEDKSLDGKKSMK